jgi:hypothetical protein
LDSIVSVTAVAEPGSMKLKSNRCTYLRRVSVPVFSEMGVLIRVLLERA